MTKKTLGSFVALGVASLLLWGIGRAATSRYEQQREALFAQCRAEQNRLGLDRDALRAKYPTPEQMLCRLTRVVPGGTGEVVAQGKFMLGTKFLFHTDDIEVVKEAATPSAYRASVKAAQAAWPSIAYLYAYQPVACRSVACDALYIGGKYEWEFTAANGWRIKLKMLDENFTAKEGLLLIGEAQKKPSPLYCAEYYRSGETQPFAARNATAAVPYTGNAQTVEASVEACGVKAQPTQETTDTQAELKKLQEKMQNLAKLSQKEQEEVMARYGELLQKNMEEQRAKLAKMSDPKEMQKLEAEKKRKEDEKKKKLAEICRSIAFQPAAGGGLEGTAYCDDWNLAGPGRYGRMPLKGTMKYLGP